MADTQEIEKRIGELGETPNIEEVLSLLDTIAAIKQFTKDAEPRLKAYVIKQIEAQGGKPVHVGEMAWMMVKKKETKCKDVKAVLLALMEVSGGDLARVNDCLGANAWKHGAIRSLLGEMKQPERYDTLFSETIIKDINGEPVRELSLVNTEFLKK